MKEHTLMETIIRLKTIEDCEAFFKDLCTPSELKAMAERWKVAQLLYAKQLSYLQIHEKTRASTTTISRVARFLNTETNGGYQRMLTA